ncbi:MAG: caspase family protein, partial [Methyloceanibacter sp.]
PIDCLPEDLIAILRQAHGQSVSAPRCENACLPAPRGLPQSHLDDLHKRAGIVWCTVCITVDSHLSLEDVRRIEKAGNLSLCATPPLQLPRHVAFTPTPNMKTFTRTRELYRALPPEAENESAIAVIIGNRNYAKLAPSETSRNDAGAMYAFLTEHLGFRQDNIIDMQDAKRADFEKLFGTAPGSDGELARLVRSRPDAKVLVYYSGHGATDSEHGDMYLLPVDTQPYRDEIAGYRLSTLYANLAKLGAKSVLLLLETEYGRDHSPYLLPPNLPETVNSALPPSPLPGLTVLLAADRGQRRLVDSTYDIGLFTRYLIEGMAGSADLSPVGNGDGQIDSAEIYVYTSAMVREAARKTFGLLQNPAYSSAGSSVLMSAGTQAREAN